ncbi:serine hydrolase domain-containing protein [Pseudoalteromonas fenneropenaei]|uniref:Serine hydrolase domain-containing protein n=1 Tax=Pseudoalteromonas fenneropenaei TaxID=1737459 RepID=A0ABV7CHZ4_9GAMM
MKYLIYLLLFMPFIVKSQDQDLALRQWNQFLAKYSKQVDAKLKEKSIPGAALTIVHGDFPDLVRGFGVTQQKNGHAVNEHTRFRLASVSKTFAGSLAAKLAADGKLDLDALVSDYLPYFNTTNYQHLRVYHLLSHSSGLVPNAYDNLIESRMPFPDIRDKLLNVDALCEPGKCYGYQNVMFSLVGDVIAKATGQSYETWVREAFFKPLGMKDGGVGFDNMQRDDNYALPHVKGQKRWHTAKLKPNYYKVAPAAGINASAKDMEKWLLAQLGYYPDVLSLDALIIQARPYTQTKRELRRRTWQQYVNEAHYGLGWRIYDYQQETVYYHSGWVQGYRTDVVILPRLKIGFSLLLNAEAGLLNELTTDFINEVLDMDALLNEKFEQQREKADN